MGSGLGRILPILCSSKGSKGQILVDFFADHPNINEPKKECEIRFISLSLWIFWFNGLMTKLTFGTRFVIDSPDKIKTKHSFKLDSMDYTNN